MNNQQVAEPKESTRADKLAQLFPTEPKFRLAQIEKALIGKAYENWQQLTELPASMRELLAKELNWLTFEPQVVLRSKNNDTFKAALKIPAGEFESVLMKNKRGSYTICVSSQIGCAMGCSFCATGKMGFKANLTSDQIIDQYRFWHHFLASNPDSFDGEPRISNIVFMGMGEPLANYINVRTAINKLLKYSDLGPTKITVSSVGVLPSLNKLLDDPEWPNVRVAISLHSADSQTRADIIKSSVNGFLDQLKDWAIRYSDLKGNRKHHVTFEYVMLNKINDSVDHAHKLGKFAKSIGGKVKINLIPYNYTGDVYRCSEEDRFSAFMQTLKSYHIDTTRRKNMGSDINAACGQLITLRAAG